MIRAAAVLLAVLTALAASAQEPLFDPDDFLDPRTTGGRPVFISRIVAGGASNMSGDGIRPLGDNIGYIHLANSFSWRSVQFDYKRSQMKAEDGQAAVWNFIDRKEEYQQTRNATPKSKDTLQAAWYWPVPSGRAIPVMLRSRVTFSTQEIGADLVEDTEVTHTSSRERTLALDTDTWFHLAGHDVFGSLAYSETKITGAPMDPNSNAPADRPQRALTYTSRLPAISYDKTRILVRPTIKVGRITNGGGSVVNLFNPAIEIFRPFARTGANLHVIWSPQWTAKDDRCEVTHQVAVFIDRALIVKRF